MKCPNCGTQNKKDSKTCKKCNESLIIKEEIKELPPVVEEVKEEVKIEEPVVETPVKKEKPVKKKMSFIRKTIITTKVLIFLVVVALIALVVYAYGFYDYKAYFSNSMNRYYETETPKYIEDIKVMFRLYTITDKKISSAQDMSYDIVNGWIDEVTGKPYLLKEEYTENLNYIQKIMDDLYENTNVNGHRAITKKSYTELSYRIKVLLLNEGPVEETQPSTNDTKEFISVDADGALEAMNKSGITIMYFGRDTCGYCVKFSPVLKEAQSKLDFTAYYMDIEKIDSNSDSFKEIEKKMDITLDIDGESTKVLEMYGYTPEIIVLRDGNIIDMEVGYVEIDTLMSFLSKYVQER